MRVSYAKDYRSITVRLVVSDDKLSQVEFVFDVGMYVVMSKNTSFLDLQ